MKLKRKTIGVKEGKANEFWLLEARLDSATIGLVSAAKVVMYR